LGLGVAKATPRIFFKKNLKFFIFLIWDEGILKKKKSEWSKCKKLKVWGMHRKN
jgi:hypothetical protein